MKKGTSIFLSICAGVAIVFGICGCLYGFNSKVHDWVNAQVGKTQDTTDSITLSLEPSWAELKRTVVADSPTASFVITAKKGDKEVADAHLVYDVDNSKAGASNIVISADKAHTAVDDDPASQFAGTYYLSGVTMTISPSGPAIRRSTSISRPTRRSALASKSPTRSKKWWSLRLATLRLRRLRLRQVRLRQQPKEVAYEQNR
jgi:hypothetical protein